MGHATKSSRTGSEVDSAPPDGGKYCGGPHVSRRRGPPPPDSRALQTRADLLPIDSDESRARVSDLAAAGPSPSRANELEAKLAALTAKDEILRVELRRPDGTIVVSDAPGLRGQRPPTSLGMQRALAGKPSANLLEASQVSDPAGPPIVAQSVVQEYLPLVGGDGQPLAVVALWRNAAPLVANIDAARRDIVLVTLAAGALLAVILFLIFRAAQARISRQQAQLLEAERRDPLTEMLNHGAVVALLAEAVEAARASDLQIGVALLDIDNFRLFNESHGHEAADEVLLRVSDLVERETENGIEVARYGPDEFLLMQRGGGVVEMEAAVARLRAGLAEVSVQFGESERLPVSASVGICAYPEHAESVTDLLSAAAVAVAEAKASGGDAVRVARAGDEAGSTSGSFDSCRAWSSRSTPKIAIPSAIPRTSLAMRSFSPSALASTMSSSAPSGSPGCCTTWARSGSPTPCCASRAS